VNGKEVETASLSSYSKAVEISNLLKDRIKGGKFFLSEPVKDLPGPDSGVKFKLLNERPFKNGGK
jgi:uncharacterized protein (DUF39 family)